jgi:hypothetical protein
MEFLRDPIWQFVGAVIGLVAIFITIYIFSAQRPTKSLAYEILTRTQLLSVEKEIRSRVQVLFEGKPVENVQLVSMRIANDGRLPIAASQFERPLSFGFGSNAMILSADITHVFPQTLKPALRVESNRLILNPTLLNSGDTIELALLLAQYNGTVQADARIEGVSEVKKEIDSPLKPLIRGMIALAVTGVVGVALTYIFIEPARPFIVIFVTGAVVTVVAGLTENLSQRVRSIRRRR